MSIADQIADIADQISDLPLATAIRTGAIWRWSFPTIETVHVIAISAVFGSIVLLDLRLLGVAVPGVKVSKYSSELLPLTWTAFILAALTGTLLFISRAPHYVFDLHFCLKMGFILLAGLNMLFFRLGVYRDVERWDSQLPPPASARIAGLISIACWTTVVFLGRWIGFST